MFAIVGIYAIHIYNTLGRQYAGDVTEANVGAPLLCGRTIATRCW